MGCLQSTYMRDLSNKAEEERHDQCWYTEVPVPELRGQQHRYTGRIDTKNRAAGLPRLATRSRTTDGCRSLRVDPNLPPPHSMVLANRPDRVSDWGDP